MMRSMALRLPRLHALWVHGVVSARFLDRELKNLIERGAVGFVEMPGGGRIYRLTEHGRAAARNLFEGQPR